MDHAQHVETGLTWNARGPGTTGGRNVARAKETDKKDLENTAEMEDLMLNFLKRGNVFHSRAVRSVQSVRTTVLWNL